MTSTLSELTCLHLNRPGAAATAADLASFYDAIAVVHEHLATDSAGTDAVRERFLATRAHARAHDLTRKEAP